MNKFNILAGLVGVIAAFTGYLFLNNQTRDIISVGTELPQSVALFETSLAAPISATAVTMTLTANSVRGGGSLSGFNCFTVDEGSAQAEFICGTVATTTVTGLTRGISPLDGTTEDTDLKFAHRRGASVKITDFPIIQLLRAQNNGDGTFSNVLEYGSAVAIATSSNEIAYATWVQNAITNQAVLTTTNQTVAGNKTFTGTTTLSGINTFATSSITILSLTSGTISTTPTASTDIANKAYVDGVAIAGASDANETTKGIVEEATLAEVIAGTTVGGTSARLFVNPAKLLGFATSTNLTYFASSSSATKLIIPSLALDANDVVEIWSTGQGSGSCGTNGMTVNIYIFNGTATTTLSTASSKYADGTPCQASAIGYYLITSALTYNITSDYSAGDQTRLLVKVQKK